MHRVPVVLCFVPRAVRTSCQGIPATPFFCSEHKFSVTTQRGSPRPRKDQQEHRRLKALSQEYEFKMKQARSFDECQLIFQKMNDEGVKRDTYLYTAAIQVSMKNQETGKSIMLIEDMRKETIPRLIPWSIAITAAGKAGKWHLSMDLLKDLQQANIEISVICYNSAISACGRGRQWQAAVDLLREMDSKGKKPNTISYNAAISACEKGKQWQAALDLLQEMDSKGMPPNTISYNAAISACEKGNQWKVALDLLREMETKGVPPSTISFNAVISACEKGNQWEKALELLREMEGKGIQPNTDSYNAAISACEKGNQWEMALDLLREMETKGIPPDTISYNAAILASAKGGLPCIASDLFQEMVDRGVTIDLTSYNAITDALHTNRRSGQALQVVAGASEVCHGAVSFPHLATNKIDLHNLSLGSASMLLLLELVKHVADGVTNADLLVITGKGLGSGPSGPVLQGGIPRFLQDSLSLSTTSVPSNSGCFVIESVSLQEWQQSESGRAMIDVIGHLTKKSWSEQDIKRVDRLLLVPMKEKLDGGGTNI